MLLNTMYYVRNHKCITDASSGDRRRAAFVPNQMQYGTLCALKYCFSKYYINYVYLNAINGMQINSVQCLYLVALGSMIWSCGACSILDDVEQNIVCKVGELPTILFFFLILSLNGGRKRCNISPVWSHIVMWIGM